MKKTVKHLTALFLSVALCFGMLPAAVPAAATGISEASEGAISYQASETGWMDVCRPYQYTEVTEYLPTSSESFSVGGVKYYEGYVFYNWYSTKISQVLYNVDGKFDSFSFKIGRIDNTKSADTTLYIFLDGKIYKEIDISASALDTEVTVPLTNVNQLKMVVQHDAHAYDVYYGLYDGVWTANGSEGTQVGESNWLDVCAPYSTEGDKTLLMLKENDDYLMMGGKKYENALQFYLWNAARSSSASFNLGGIYDTFSFTVGHVDNTARYSAKLKVYLDGELKETIEMQPDDLQRRYTVSVKDAKQMILKLESDEELNCYDITYGVGEGVLHSDGVVREISLEETEISISDDGTAILKPVFTPWDAADKKLVYESMNPDIATVDAFGVVTGIKNGSATIKVTTEDGGYTAFCTVQVDMEQIIYGDLNGSGSADAGDALLVLKEVVSLLELDAAQQQAADVNADGKISAEDALMILRKVVNLIGSFPAEQ